MSDSGWDFPPGGGAQGPAGPPGVTAGADLAVRSITVLPNSPYAPTAAAGWVDPIGVGQWGDGVYNVKSSKNTGAAGPAKGDGVTNDTLALQAAITAAKGGIGADTVLCGSGTYNFTSLDASGAGSCSIRGNGIDSPRLSCTATGAGTGINGSTSYFSMENLTVQYTSGSFTGTLVTANGITTAEPTFRRCLFWGNGSATATYLLDITGSSVATIDTCQFASAQYAILGRKTDGTLPNNGCYINACYFAGTLTVAAIRNVGAGVQIRSTFENLANGKGAALVMDAACVGQGLDFAGCWMGDATDVTAWTWIQFQGQGLSVSGSYIHGTGANQSTAITIIGASSGISVTGNELDHHLVALALGASLASQVLMAANDLANTTSAWTGTVLTPSYIQGNAATPGGLQLINNSGIAWAANTLIDYVSGSNQLRLNPSGGAGSVHVQGGPLVNEQDFQLGIAGVRSRLLAVQTTAPTVGSGGTGVSALSVIAGSTNTYVQVQATLTAIAPGVVVGVVAFDGAALASAPKAVVCSLSAPTAGVAAPPVIGADTYTTSGFTIRSYGPTTVTTGTYIITCHIFF